MNSPTPDPHLTRVLAQPPGKASRQDSPASWFYGDTHTGQVRTNNEDRFLCDEGRGLFIVADGMGGHAAGEEASRIVISVLSDALCLRTGPDDFSPQTLALALQSANSEVIRQSESNYQWRGMGSTAVVVLIQDGTLYLANAGDSRAYVLRQGQLHQVSRDHSVAAGLAEQYQISRAEIRTHALRNRLTMCLGIEQRVQPETLQFDLQRNDCLLLCSDGLWDMLPDDEITQLLHRYPSPREAVNALIHAANAAGGKDNITAVVIYPQVTTAPTNPAFAAGKTDFAADSSEDTVVLRDSVSA